jgi:hypothetical protein
MGSVMMGTLEDDASINQIDKYGKLGFYAVSGVAGKGKASMGINESGNGVIELLDKNGNKLK